MNSSSVDQSNARDAKSRVEGEIPTVYLCDAGGRASDGEWDECWVPCSKGDPGAVEFVEGASLDDREERLTATARRLAAMEALMIRWRIAAQRWTPGGSEYMDPAYCEKFIRDQRLEAHCDKVASFRLRKAMERIAEATPESTNSATIGQFQSWVRAVANTALSDAPSRDTSPSDTAGSSAGSVSHREEPK